MRFQHKRPVAYARLRGSRQVSGLIGIVRFYQLPGSIVVEIRVTGLPGSGFFGLHIHEDSACQGPDFSSAGSHYNPASRTHPYHAGDLPPLLSCSGRAYLAVMSDRFSLPDILGRTVVVHSRADDFRSQPAGDSGDRIACGIIKKYQ